LTDGKKPPRIQFHELEPSNARRQTRSTDPHGFPMKALAASFSLLLGLYFGGASLRGATVFEDGFESSSIAAEWSVTRIGNGRAGITRDHGPATGDAHLVLDDAVSDALFSVAEVTLALDLSNKKNVVLSFKAKSLGNEAHPAPEGAFTGTRAYDGVAISMDGGTTWWTAQSLDAVPGAWTSYEVSLDPIAAAIGEGFGPGFRLRFSEYDNAPAPLDGIAIDDVLVTADDDEQAVFELPSPLVEGTGPHTGYVLLAFPPASPVTLTLSSSPGNQLSLPSTVTIPAGDTYASFQFSVLDDSLVNLTRSITVDAMAAGITVTPGSIVVTDNDVPVANLTLPAQLVEGAVTSNNATLAIDKITTSDFTVNLAASPSNELIVPAAVTIPAGESQVAFTVSAEDDMRIDGSVNVTVTASASGMASVNTSTTTVDNEARTLGLVLPITVSEAGTATGNATISGSLASDLEVSVGSSNEAAVTVPAIVTIPAGETQATFTITASNNDLRDGTRSVNLAASAAAFTGASQTISVLDNDPASYRFSALGSLVNLTGPRNVSVSAVDVEGNTIIGFSGSVSLSVVLPDGTTQPLTPASASIGGWGWSGNVTLPALAASPLRLRASDANGNSGDSDRFDTLRTLPFQAADLVWDPTRQRIYASVPAGATGPYANKVVAIDPVTLQITASATTNQDPGQLALTSGGEALYVALNNNGTIARINPSTMTVASSFAVGTDPTYGTLYAADICTVAGQPDVLVVSQYRKGVSPRHNGVAAYENGIRRPSKTQDHTGSNFIEPSSDASMFFGYNSESTEFGFRRLKLDSNGMTELEVNSTLLGGFYADMRSDGDKVYSTTGTGVDGALMRKLGAFATTGLVRPDSASRRVYYLEPSSLYYPGYDAIAAYDPTTFSLVRRITLTSEVISPTGFIRRLSEVTSPTGFIRWGSTGLAFSAGGTVYLINSSQLVPSDPPADLVVTAQANPDAARVGEPLTYTVQVTNQGPNTARGTMLTATLSDSQMIQSATASTGTTSTNGRVVSLNAEDLSVGATATLTIVVAPQSAGALTCSAIASSDAVDPDWANNISSELVSVGFVSGPDVVNELRLTANNVVYDATRQVLWVTIPSTAAAPLGNSLISVNPSNGLMSDAIPINASPMSQCMALSPNGRYLYIGLSEIPEVHRIDLSSSPMTSTRIPLGLSQWGSVNYAEDIEVLDGDGTSFIMVGSADHSAAVYDGTVRRANRSGIYTVGCIERTATTNTFVGYNNVTTGFGTTRLNITSTGVTVAQTVSNLISGFVEIAGAGNFLLSSTGVLADSISLTLISNLGVSGRPCVDQAYQRAYLVNSGGLWSFDAATGLPAGSMALPTSNWPKSCVRWGADGFAMLGADKLYLARWSAAIPAGADADANGLADSWENSHFGVLGVSLTGDADGDGLANGLEYLLVTPPRAANSSPIQTSTSIEGGHRIINLVFSRRAGVGSSFYAYECSPDTQSWMAPASVVETVVSTQTIAGSQVEVVHAAVRSPGPSSGFVRLKLLSP
jgi:uncharacterized repeat protein (TIGR01451 family)